MSGPTFDAAQQIIKPDPDSQYRLIPCGCSSQEVVYEQYRDPETGAPLWRVVCKDCGATVDIHTNIRHQVQVAWNNWRKSNG